jgi:hypothetical protein
MLIAKQLWLTAYPVAADDFAERWSALNPPTVEIGDDPPLPRRAHYTTCHRIWFTRQHHRYWRCQR